MCFQTFKLIFGNVKLNKGFFQLIGTMQLSHNLSLKTSEFFLKKWKTFLVKNIVGKQIIHMAMAIMRKGGGKQKLHVRKYNPRIEMKKKYLYCSFPPNLRTTQRLMPQRSTLEFNTKTTYSILSLIIYECFDYKIIQNTIPNTRQ